MPHNIEMDDILFVKNYQGGIDFYQVTGFISARFVLLRRIKAKDQFIGPEFLKKVGTDGSIKISHTAKAYYLKY